MIYERSNFGLIVFDKENIEKYKNLEDTYYLIVIDSENINSNISLNIQAISKNDSQFSLSINKYIGGSFNLKNNNIQSQQYYIKGLEKAQLNIFTFEFSSNYENIGLDFGNNIENISEVKFGGIKKYNVCINYAIESENYFFVSLKGNNTNNGENNNYLENVNYILRYYPTEKGNEFNYKFDFEGIKELKNNSCELAIKNKNFNTNFSGKYMFTYIFSIFKEKKMKKNELINTIAPINSEKIYLNTTYDNKTIDKIIFNLNKDIFEEEYKGSVFIKVQSVVDENQKSYYSYAYDIRKKTIVNENENNNTSKNDNDGLSIGVKIILGLFVITIIIIIIISILYKNILQKNRVLEEKVNSISFLSDTEEQEKENNDVITFI